MTSSLRAARLVLLGLAVLLAPRLAGAATPLDGSWQVDLTTDPATPYFKAMVLDLRADGTVAGSFYDSTIEAGRWQTARGRTCVSFRTTDGRGPYHTSACLDGETMRGQTWAEHRSFVFLWNATRGLKP